MRRRGFLGILGGSALPSWSQTKSEFALATRLDEGIRITDLTPDGHSAPLVLAQGRDGGLLVRRIGGRWVSEALPERAKSIASDGKQYWIAAASGIWRRAVDGSKWERSWEGEGLERILFAGAKGYATGAGKTILETSGDNEWRRVAAADDPTTNTANTTYHWIHFVNERVGIISGASRAPRGGQTDEFPAWMDPQRATRRKEWPGASLTLETRDGGKTWRHGVTSIFGKITRVRYARDGRGLALVEFHDEFEWPSEVFAIDLKTGSSDRVFRRKDRAVTDTWLFAGRGYLAAIEPPADPAGSRLGKLCLFQSEDLREWRELTLPEAWCSRAWLAGTPSGEVWIATDSGLLFEPRGMGG